MQVPPLDAAALVSVPTGTAISARVVSGNLATVPIGALLDATVTSVGPREAVLSVKGQPVTVRPPAGLPPLTPGAALVVRIPPGAQAVPALELFAPAPATAQTPAPNGPVVASAAVPRAGVEAASVGRTALPDAPARAVPDKPTATAPDRAPRLAVIDVRAPLPDGRVRVSIDGVEQTATPATKEPLAPGGRYVLQVERAAGGVVLKTPPPSPALAAEVATAILRVPAPDLSAAVEPLRAELAAFAQLAKPQAPGGAVRAAAVAVSETLEALVPREPRPPRASDLQQLIENGGRHFEAKLARAAEALDSPEPDAPTKPQAVGREPQVSTREQQSAARESTPPAPARERQSPQEAVRAAAGSDLKGDLLRLMQAVNDLGGAARAPAAEAALHVIESQQATQVLAQANGTPYYLQVPFPDRGVWRTLNLALEPQSRPDHPDADRASRFRVFMHVPLTDLGETWIDAGLADDRFRATIYLERPTVRDRVRAGLDTLRAELKAEGYSEVLLDVRAASDLPERHRREAATMTAGRPDTVSVLDVRA